VEYADILLNVFLAIAVDNLGDAEEADEEEEAKKAELAATASTAAAEPQVPVFISQSYNYNCCCFYASACPIVGSRYIIFSACPSVCACVRACWHTRTVISLLLHPVITHCAYVVCYFRNVYLFIYFIIAIYVHHVGLCCVLFRRFVISKINVALQLTKL